MSISVDGNSLIINDCTLTLNNAFDPTTGIATITITPSGGLGTLPALVNGTPGLPPGISIGTVTTLSAGASATAALTQLTAGGPGTASTYALNLGIPVGATGSTGSFTIQTATDYALGSGSLTTGNALIYNSSTSKFNPLPLPLASANFPTAINSTSGTGAGPRQLASVVIPAQTYPWYPLVSAQTIVSGTVNTQVNLQAYITNTSGQQVGIGYSAPGIANQVVTLISAAPTGSGSTYGQVSAGTTATIVLYATQVASTSDAWSTSASTTSFQVIELPV